MFSKKIVWFGRDVTLVCDGRCSKAWGISSRPVVRFDDEDDYAFLSDGELGEAPKDPGTYEGEYGKPDGPQNINKWCSRECERSRLVEQGEDVTVRDFSERCYNQPWKHTRDGLQ